MKSMLRVNCFLPPPPASLATRYPYSTRRRREKFTTCLRTYFHATVFDNRFPPRVAPPYAPTLALPPRPTPPDTRRRRGRAGPPHRTFFRDKCATRKHWRDPAAQHLPPEYP